MHAFLSSNESFPSGSVSKQYAPAPSHPHNFYRWSALAQLTPYLEQTIAYEQINFELPMYAPSLSVTPENTSIVARVLAGFLCPSDPVRESSVGFGPTNYAACSGSGAGGGSPFALADGIFYINSRTKTGDVSDGLSRTAAFSESLLGRGPEPLFDAKQAHPDRMYKFSNVTPLTQAACNSSMLFNFTNRRGFSWTNGEYRCVLYNHALPPNSKSYDCVSSLLVGSVEVRFSAYGWRAARSAHPTGVHVLLADGSVQFVDDEVDPAVWSALGTRNGNETFTLPF